MIGYKLFRKRKDGSYGSLFINKKQILEVGKWYLYEYHPTKGYANRPGWHICKNPHAPHLSMKGRVWCKVAFTRMQTLERPEHQGGVWYLGLEMKILGEYNERNKHDE